MIDLNKLPPEIRKEVEDGRAMVVPVWRQKYTWTHFAATAAFTCFVIYMAIVNASWSTGVVLFLGGATLATSAVLVLLSKLIATLITELEVNYQFFRKLNKELQEAVAARKDEGTFTDETCLSVDTTEQQD